MKKALLFLTLNVTLVALAMDNGDLKNKKADQQSISRAQSFVLGKPFKMIGNDFIMYPHYLNDQHEEYYVEHRGIALAQLQRLKEHAHIEYLYLVQRMNIRFTALREINLEQKLIPQLQEDELLGACAQFVEDFHDNFEADSKDFGPHKQEKWTHAKNRKKFYDALKSGACKDEINAAAQAPLGTSNLHDFYAEITAAMLAMQYTTGNQKPNVLDLCDFLHVKKIWGEGEQEKFSAKYKEIMEKLEKTR